MITKFNKYKLNESVNISNSDFPVDTYVGVDCTNMKSFMTSLENIGLSSESPRILVSDKFFDKKTGKFKVPKIYIVKQVGNQGSIAFNIHSDLDYFERKVPGKYGRDWKYAGDAMNPEEIETYINANKYNL